MKILKVTTETLVHRMDDTALDRLFSESIQNIMLLKKLEDALNITEEEYEDEKKDEILEAMEELSFKCQLTYLDQFTQGMCAPNSSLKRRADNTMEYLQRILEPCRKLVAVWLSPDTLTEESMRKITYSTLSEYTHLVYYQFLMNLTWDTRDKGQDLEISAVLERYCSGNRISPTEFVGTVRDIMITHRPSLHFADAFPEQMDEIYDRMGAYVKDLEELDELVDINLIKALLADEITPEFIIQFLEEKRGDK